MIFQNVRWPGQKIIFRTDFTGNKQFTANNVIFDKCELYPTDWNKYVAGTPPKGVTFKNCYQSGGTLIIGAIGNKSVYENSILTFDVNATNPKSGTITYSAQNLPSGAMFSDQTFSWTPNYGQAGSYQVRFIASDGNSQDSETITITVNNVNRAPVIGAIANQ